MTAILGQETITMEQCRQFLLKFNPNAPDIIPYYKAYGETLGIKWGYAVAQMMKETAYLKYGGDVQPAQYNYAGIGATGGGVVGASFDTPEQGVLAHLEHLYAYASTDLLPAGLDKVDPRFDLVTRGAAQNWEDLNGRWAVPGIGYGESIGKIYEQMKGEIIVSKIVCIDPGHNASGVDTGAAGNGLYEQDITLKIALKLKSLLEASGLKVVMTRESGNVPGSYSNVEGSLQARCAISNTAEADLFVSIHVNAGGGTGAEVWVLARGGNAEKAAKDVLEQLVDCGFRDRGVKTANDYVLNYTDAPAILTENGFIDTVADAEKLKSDAFLESLAEAHAKGICKYFGITYRKENDVLKTAVLLYTKEDFWAGYDVAAKNGNCAIFVRPADLSVPAEAQVAEKLIVVGGATTGHANEVLLSGKDKYATAAAVAKYLG